MSLRKNVGTTYNKAPQCHSRRMRPLSLDDYMALSLTQPVTASSTASPQWGKSLYKVTTINCLTFEFKFWILMKAPQCHLWRMRPLSLDDYMALSLTQPVTASNIASAQSGIKAFLKLFQVYSKVLINKYHTCAIITRSWLKIALKY